MAKDKPKNNTDPWKSVKADAAKTLIYSTVPESTLEDMRDAPTTNLYGASDIGKIQSRFAGSLATSGALFNQSINYDLSYNALHAFGYFDPYLAANVHIFMVRPFCNFSPVNIAASERLMQAALSTRGCALMAQLMYPGHHDTTVTDTANEYSNAAFQFNNLDQYGLQKVGYTPFMPRISNLCLGISGLKDLIMEKYEYDGDRAGNRTADAKGTQEAESSAEITLSFLEDSDGSITQLHTFWMEYIDKVGYGTMNPMKCYMEELIYDYMCSIFFFVTGQDGMSIKWYGECTGIFPISLPTQNMIPNERGQYTDPKISITYHANHVKQNHPNILNRFNRLIYDCWAKSQTKGLNNPPDYKDGKYLRPYGSGMIHTWLGNEFDASKGQDTSRGGAESLEKIDLNKFAQEKYHKYMAPSPTTFSNKTIFGDAGPKIFAPSLSVTWHGHPYIIDGKLVYMDLSGPIPNNMGIYERRNMRRTSESVLGTTGTENFQRDDDSGNYFTDSLHDKTGISFDDLSDKEKDIKWVPPPPEPTGDAPPPQNNGN